MERNRNLRLPWKGIQPETRALALTASELPHDWKPGRATVLQTSDEAMGLMGDSMKPRER